MTIEPVLGPASGWYCAPFGNCDRPTGADYAFALEIILSTNKLCRNASTILVPRACSAVRA